MHKGISKLGSHSHSSINSFTGDFFLLEREVLFGIVKGERGHLKNKDDHCAMNSSWENFGIYARRMN